MMYTSIPLWTDDVGKPVADAALISFEYNIDEYGTGQLMMTFSALVEKLSPREFSKLQQIAYEAIADYARNQGYDVSEQGGIHLYEPVSDAPEYFVEYEDDDDEEDYGFNIGRWSPFDTR